MKIHALYMFIIAIVLACIGCTSQVDCYGTYTYNPNDFTSEQKVWIENAAHRWNNWVGYNLVHVSPGIENTCNIHNGKTTDPTKVGQDHHPSELITIDVEHLQQINRLNQVRFESIVMHELGHSLGYSHILTGKALMAPISADDFTDLDRIECIKHDMCPALLPSSN